MQTALAKKTVRTLGDLALELQGQSSSTLVNTEEREQFEIKKQEVINFLIHIDISEIPNIFNEVLKSHSDYLNSELTRLDNEMNTSKNKLLLATSLLKREDEEI